MTTASELLTTKQGDERWWKQDDSNRHSAYATPPHAKRLNRTLPFGHPIVLALESQPTFAEGFDFGTWGRIAELLVVR